MVCKRIAGVAALLALVLMVAGCCSEEQCKEKYGLLKTAEECWDAHDHVCPPPLEAGPMVLLETCESDPQLLCWTVGGTLLKPGPSIFEQEEECTLRSDFIGPFPRLFQYLPRRASGWENGIDVGGRDDVLAAKPGVEVEIWPSRSFINWKIIDTAGGRVCRPAPTDVFEPDEVPEELYNLLHRNLYVATQPDPGVEAGALRLQMSRP
jgi:hypothetical protein